MLTPITCHTLTCDTCGVPALTEDDAVCHLATPAQARARFGPDPAAGTIDSDPFRPDPWRFTPEGTHTCPACQTHPTGQDEREPGEGAQVVQDPYRVRSYRGLLGGWYAEVDYLGDLEYLGDQRITRTRGRTRLAAVTKALHVAATEHDTWAPGALLVVEVSGTRFTGDDARPGTWRP